MLVTIFHINSTIILLDPPQIIVTQTKFLRDLAAIDYTMNNEKDYDKLKADYDLLKVQYQALAAQNCRFRSGRFWK